MPLIASLKKTEEPASTFSDLTNITISIPQLRRSNPKCNGKKNFVLDELFEGHLKVNYDNWIECEICKQWYRVICENIDPDSYINI